MRVGSAAHARFERLTCVSRGLPRRFSGSRANNTPCPRQFCPKRRPPRPRHPIIGVFRRGGLHFGRHTAPNRDPSAPNRDPSAPNRDLTTPNRDLTTPNRDLTATKRGGNCSIRGATRRRHAVVRLLMVQNPHHQRCDALRKGQRARAGPGAACFPMTPPPNGGNCTNRGATRRRHAGRMLLMVQNPHHYPWRHTPSLVQGSPAGRR